MTADILWNISLVMCAISIVLGAYNIVLYITGRECLDDLITSLLMAGSIPAINLFFISGAIICFTIWLVCDACTTLRWKAIEKREARRCSYTRPSSYKRHRGHVTTDGADVADSSCSSSGD